MVKGEDGKFVEIEFTLKIEEDKNMWKQTYLCMLKEIILKWTSNKNFLIMDFNVFCTADDDDEMEQCKFREEFLKS